MPTERLVDDSGNIVRRLSAPAGAVSLRLEGVFHSDGREDEVEPAADAIGASDLPPGYAAIPWAQPILRDRSSFRFRLGELRLDWRRLAAGAGDLRLRPPTPPLSYPEARTTRTANEALAEGVGVCRDFTHLAVALCRCLNIPARYCNGYLGDIGVRPTPRRWISTPGSKPFSATAGSLSTRGTISRELAAF